MGNLDFNDLGEKAKEILINSNTLYALTLSVVPAIVAGIGGMVPPRKFDVKCQVQYRDGNEFKCKTHYGTKTVKVQGQGSGDFSRTIQPGERFTYKTLGSYLRGPEHRISTKNVISVNGKKLPR